MDEEARNKIINLINNASDDVKDMARIAYLFGHEDGWWLNRKNPDVPAAEHARKTCPFEYSDPKLGELIEQAYALDPDPQEPAS